MSTVPFKSQYITHKLTFRLKVGSHSRWGCKHTWMVFLQVFTKCFKMCLFFNTLNFKLLLKFNDGSKNHIVNFSFPAKWKFSSKSRRKRIPREWLSWEFPFPNATLELSELFKCIFKISVHLHLNYARLSTNVSSTSDVISI